jgi:hypothetical protein
VPVSEDHPWHEEVTLKTNQRHSLSDAPLVDVVVTTRCAVSRMAPLRLVEVGEIGPEEAMALFRKLAQLRCEGPGVDGEVCRIVDELGFLDLAIALAGSHVGATPRLRSNVQLYLSEYHAQRRMLLDARTKKYVHRYGESVPRHLRMALWPDSPPRPRKYLLTLRAPRAQLTLYT